MKNVIAWMGGSRPRPYNRISAEERELVRAIFRDSMRAVYEFWGDYVGLCESVLDSARIHWKHARYDAHATMRGA